MISIHCTNCRTLLEIDDAFAGGCCRCQYCGTIQTVPATLRKSKIGAGLAGDTGEPSDGGIPSPRTIYKGRTRETGSGLDDLADAVTGSGTGKFRAIQPPRPSVTGKHGRQTHPTTPLPVALPAKRHSRAPWLIGAVIVVTLAVAGVWFASARHTDHNAASTADTTSTNLPLVTDGPRFCGVPLNGQTVVFLLDRDNSTRDIFDALKESCLDSLGTLNSDTHFQVLFWDNGTSPAGFPLNSATAATPDSVTDCRRALANVNAFGKTHIDDALKRALASDPDILVIATAKGANLDNSFLDPIRQAVAGRHVTVDTFSLGQGIESPALKQIAELTGGRYRVIGEGSLKPDSP